MARSNFVKKARHDIYQQGKRVEYVSQKGKRAGQTLFSVDKSQPANNSDNILIKKGEPYYWWQFKNSPKSYSKTPPKASQLTRSAYLSQLYDLQDRLSDIRSNVNDADDLSSTVDEVKSDIESLREETQSSLDNMPEHLQESSSSGELLNERIQALESAEGELDSIDLDYDEPSEEDLREEAEEELGDEAEEEEIMERIEELKEEKLSQWLDEKSEEISNISLE